MFHIDTNVAIAIINKSSAAAADRFEDPTARRLVEVSVIVLFELRFGIANISRFIENQHRLDVFLATPITIIPFVEDDAYEAGVIRADLKSKGTPIGPYDLLIAAQARRRSATLVTANTREFARVPGLALADWTAA